MTFALAIAFLLVSTFALILLDRRQRSTPASAIPSPSFAEAVTRARRIRAEASRELARAHGHVTQQAVTRRRLRPTGQQPDVDAPSP